MYGVLHGANGEPTYREIPADQIEDVCFYDVAYVCSKTDPGPGNVEWRREYRVVCSDDEEIVSQKGAMLYSDDFTERKCGKLPFCFKKRGWSNERETRLVVSLKPDASQWEHIAIPFDGPLAFVESHKKEYIVLGPWHKEGGLNGLIDERIVGRSVFSGELQQ